MKMSSRKYHLYMSDTPKGTINIYDRSYNLIISIRKRCVKLLVDMIINLFEFTNDEEE